MQVCICTHLHNEVLLARRSGLAGRAGLDPSRETGRVAEDSPEWARDAELLPEGPGSADRCHKYSDPQLPAAVAPRAASLFPSPSLLPGKSFVCLCLNENKSGFSHSLEVIALVVRGDTWLLSPSGSAPAERPERAGFPGGCLPQAAPTSTINSLLSVCALRETEGAWDADQGESHQTVHVLSQAQL